MNGMRCKGVIILILICMCIRTEMWLIELWSCNSESLLHKNTRWKNNDRLCTNMVDRCPGKVCMAAELAERIAVVTHHSYILFHCFEHTLKVKFCTFSRESNSLILDVCQTWLAQALNTSARDSQDLNADKNGSKLDQLASHSFTTETCSLKYSATQSGILSTFKIGGQL